MIQGGRREASALHVVQNLISTGEILGTIRDSDGAVQVCATADADYDHAVEKISFALDAFTRRASATERAPTGGTSHPNLALPLPDSAS